MPAGAPRRSSSLAAFHILPPIGATQHAHDSGCHCRAFAASDSVEVNGASRIKPIDCCPPESFRNRRSVRHHSHADLRLEQFDQVAFGADVVALIEVQAVFAKRGAEAIGMFAIVP